MLPQVEDLMKELGWADGFCIPVANEENKALEKEVEEQLRKKAEKKIALDELQERLESLKTRDKHLLEELKQLDELVAAYETQCNAENEMILSLEREHSIIRQEKQNCKKKLNELRDSRHSLENEKLQLRSKLKGLKASVEWGEEALQAWKEDLSKNSGDANLLEKYQLEDDSKFCEVEVKRQKLLSDVMQAQNTLNRLVSELKISENELCHTTKMFRQAHEERNKLLEQWGAAVNFLQARDDTIMKTLMELQNLKKSGREKYKQLLQERQFYEEQFKDNSELYASITEKSTNCEHLREEKLRINEVLQEISSQVLTSQRALAELEHELAREEKEEKKLMEECDIKEASVKCLTESIEDLKNKLKTLKTETSEALERSRIPHKIYDDKVKLLEQISVKQKRLHDSMHKTESELSAIKKEGELCFQEIQFSEAHAAALDKKMKSISKEIFHQEEMLYNQNLQLTQINTEISFLEGKRDSEYLESLKKEIEMLEIDLKEKTKDHDFILTQVTQSEDELKRIKSEFSKDDPEISKLKDSITDLSIIVENGQRQIRIAENEVNDKRVEENLLKLRASHLEKLVARGGASLCDLEKQRSFLEAAMKERLIEIKTMRTILITHKKALQDDLSELKKSVEHLNIRINQLKKRLEIIQDTMGEYKGSDQVTVIQLKIKIAQTKGELQEEGDDLDAKINKAEQEITAMENTLQVINASNNLYKRSLSAVDSDAPEVKELKEMERQYHAASQARKALEEKLKSLHEEIERIEKSHCELKSSEEELKKVYQQKDRDAQELDRHLENQERKLQRADKVLKKLIREVHLNVERAPVIEFAEQDIKVRELKELNQSALLLLADLSARYMETGPTINRYLAEKSLTLPSVYAAGPSISSRSKPPSSVSSHLPSHGPSNLSIDGSALHLDKTPSSSVPNVMILNPDIIGTSKETAGSQKKVVLQGAESQRQKKSNYAGAKRKDSKS